MISLGLFLAVASVALFIIAIATVLGGIAGLSIVGQIVIGIFAIMFLFKILFDK